MGRDGITELNNRRSKGCTEVCLDIPMDTCTHIHTYTHTIQVHTECYNKDVYVLYNLVHSPLIHLSKRALANSV